jgi:ABC-type sugar transport system permease subunit/ABC-type glycerol-3-phosphate transport system substrate-binding protein
LRPASFRLLLAGFVALCCAFQMAGAQAQPQKKIQLHVWNLPTRDQAVNPDAKATLAIADQYRRDHPTVELLPFEGLNVEGVASMDSGPLMAMAGGVAPEVLYVNFRISETFISQGFLYPLDDYVAQWEQEVGKETLNKLIPPQVWRVIKRKGPPDGKEHIYAIPYGVVVMALMYRKDLFKAAGIDPEKAPQNWDEMYDYAMRMTDPKKGTFGLGLHSKTDAAWQFMSFLWSAGSDAVVEDPNGDWRAAYDDEGAVKACEYYWKLRRGKWTRCPECNEPVAFPPGQKEARCKNGHLQNADNAKAEDRLYEGVVDIDPYTSRTWDRGKLGMMFQYLRDEFIAQVNPSQTGISPVPAGPGGVRGSEINSTMYGINSTIKDPAVRDAAWDYIKFTGSKEAKKIKTRIFVEAGFAKYVNPEWLREFGYMEYVRDVPPGWADVLAEAIRDSQPEPYGKNCQLIYREMQIPLDKIVAEETPTSDSIRAILKTEVAATNAKLLGRLSPEVKTFRDRVALIAVIAIGIAFVLMLKISFSQFSTQIKSQSSSAVTDTVVGGGHKRHRVISAWMVMGPALLLIALFSYYPLARGSLMAFQDYRILLPSHWVGVSNFAQVFFAAEFWKTMLRTAEYALLSLGLGFVAPILLALLLHEVPRGKVLYRTLFYLPAVTTGVVIYMLWKLFYDPGPTGFLNQIIMFLGNVYRYRFAEPVGTTTIIAVLVAAVAVGVGPVWYLLRPRRDGKVPPAWIVALAPLWTAAAIVGGLWLLRILGGGLVLPKGTSLIEAQKWLQNPKQAMLCIVLSQIWAGIGPGCIIYLAAMRAIPEELYEAADLDGAGFWGKFRRITIPYLKALIIINFVGAFIAASRTFDPIFIMTGGGPAQATTVLGLDIWYNAFMYLKYGLAVSMAWILGSLLIGFTVTQLRILSRLQYTTAKPKGM